MPPTPKGDRQPAIFIIRKKKAHHAHHGGAWKVAFADFMTAMFALFLVLWLINQSSDVKSAIAGYFQDPLGRADEFGSSIIPGSGAQAQTARKSMEISDIFEVRQDKLQNVAKNLEKRMAQMPALEKLRDNVEITLTDEGLKIELIENENGYFFEKGNAAPNSAGKGILALLGEELGTLPLPVRIDGHTDAHAFQSEVGYTNWELSADRANTARRIMVQSGLAGVQVAQVRAFAASQPREGADPYAAGNRRVTITMLYEAPGDGGEVGATGATR